MTLKSESMANRNEVFGVLNPIAWSSMGDATKFSIYSKGEDIIIGNYENREKLRNLLKKNVVASGTIYVNKRGEKIIFLQEIREVKKAKVNLMLRDEFASWEEDHAIKIPQSYAFIQGSLSDDFIWEAG